MSTDNATAHPVTHGADPLTIEQNRSADLLDRATTYRAQIGPDPDPDVADLRREIDDLTAALDNTTQALAQQRPAPDPRWLGTRLKLAWFRPTRTPGAGDHIERWTAVAETAIDAVRGLWPADTPTVAGGGERAVSPPPLATGAPAPGDTHHFTPCPRCRAYLGAHRICGACEADLPAPMRDIPSGLEQLADAHILGLARAMCAPDETAWERIGPGVRDFYLRRATHALGYLAEQGWRPPAAPTAAASGAST